MYNEEMGYRTEFPDLAPYLSRYLSILIISREQKRAKV
jgi:hypothetical protein